MTDGTIHARGLCKAFVGCDIGLGRRADVKLQAPTAGSVRFGAPQFQRANFAQTRVQVDGDRAGIARFARA